MQVLAFHHHFGIDRAFGRVLFNGRYGIVDGKRLLGNSRTGHVGDADDAGFVTGDHFGDQFLRTDAIRDSRSGTTDQNGIDALQVITCDRYFRAYLSFFGTETGQYRRLFLRRRNIRFLAPRQQKDKGTKYYVQNMLFHNSFFFFS